MELRRLCHEYKTALLRFQSTGMAYAAPEFRAENEQPVWTVVVHKDMLIPSISMYSPGITALAMGSDADEASVTVSREKDELRVLLQEIQHENRILKQQLAALENGIGCITLHMPLSEFVWLSHLDS